MNLAERIERELIEGLRAPRRRELIERLRGNPDQRRGWDRAIAAFRALERREVSRVEVDQVERWLFEDLDAAGVIADRAPAQGRRWTTLAAALATLATSAALLLWIDRDPTSDEPIAELAQVEVDELRARGARTWTRPLALDLACGEPVRAAPQRGCRLDELLGFSLRLGDEALAPEQAAALAQAPLHLSVFGIAASGELLYYTPTPIEPAQATLRLGGSWQPLPLSVRLAVNHAPGRVRVFALASDRPAELADVERWAAALRSQPSADLDDPPWHLRLAPSVLGPVCARADRCASAETELTLLTAHEAPRTDP
jgi:hypothetical protein